MRLGGPVGEVIPWDYDADLVLVKPLGRDCHGTGPILRHPFKPLASSFCWEYSKLALNADMIWDCHGTFFGDCTRMARSRCLSLWSRSQ